MLHMFCELYQQKARHVDGARSRRHRMRTRKQSSTKKTGEGLPPMEAEDVLRTLRDRHSDLLALHKTRPNERNRANVLGAKRAYLEHKFLLKGE